MNPMALNSNTYEIGASTSNAVATLVQGDINTSRWIIYNGATTNAFVVGGVTSPTAVFPTSATAPLAGKVIAPGSTQTFAKDSKHAFLAVILESGTGSVFVSVGTGD